MIVSSLKKWQAQGNVIDWKVHLSFYQIYLDQI